MGNLKSTLAAALLAIGLSPGLMAQGAAHSTLSPSSPPPCEPSPSRDVALTQAFTAMEQAQYSQVIEALQPFAAAPCDPHLTMLLAAAYEASGDAAGAERNLQQGHAAFPADNDIAASLARLYLARNNKADALRALEQFRASPETPWREIQLAVVVFLANHQLQKADAAASSGFKFYPSLDSLLLLANTLQLEGRYKDVISLLNGQRATYSGSAPFLITLAQSEYDAAMYDPARADVQAANALDGKIYAAHYLLGNLLLKTGQPEAAVDEYRAAMQLSPGQPRTYYYLALSLRAMHKDADEEQVLRQAIALDNSYALAHCELGRILLNGNRVNDAVEQLTAAVADNASSEQAYYLLSRAYSRLGDQAKADAMAKRLTEVRQANHTAQPHSASEPPA